jgi:hypothetical protein
MLGKCSQHLLHAFIETSIPGPLPDDYKYYVQTVASANATLPPHIEEFLAAKDYAITPANLTNLTEEQLMGWFELHYQRDCVQIYIVLVGVETVRSNVRLFPGTWRRLSWEDKETVT